MSDNWNTYEERLKQESQNIKTSLNGRLKQIHTTRLHPDLISEIKILSYGEEVALKSIANIQLTTARSFTIKAYDSSINDEIDKGIRKSRPDFNPIINGDSITLSFPSPTEESRKKSVKDSKNYLEDSKITLRLLRQNVLQDIKKSDLPKDVEKKFSNNVENFIKQISFELEKIFSDKEKELMTI